MTARTFTTQRTTSAASTKAVHAGAQSVSAVYSASDTLSAGDTIQMVKVPAGAVVTDVTLRIAPTSGQVMQVGVGDGGSTERFIASASGTSVVRATAGVPYSYSADDTVDVLISGVGSLCAGSTITLTVTYKMDDPITTN